MSILKYICLIFLLAGCTQVEKADLLEISPEYFVDQRITLSDIADDIEYIPLSSDVVVPHILSAQITDNLIVFNGSHPTGIFEFNRNGSFIKKIGRTGRGPGEYVTGIRITLDCKNQRIYILDSGKLLTYDFNGILIQEKTTPAYSDFNEILYHENKLYLFANLSNSIYFNPSNYWIILDTLGNKLSSKQNTTTGLPENKSITTFGENLAYRFNNKIYYQNAYNDTIFEIQDTLCKAAYLFKHDEYRLTPEISGNDENFGLNKHYIVNCLFESHNYIYICYRQYSKTHYCLYDKQAGIFRNYTLEENQKTGLINDIDAGLPFPLEEMVNLGDKEYLIGSINPYELKAHIASDAYKTSTPKKPEKKKELEQLANSLDENDNPVLMLVKLKE